MNRSPSPHIPRSPEQHAPSMRHAGPGQAVPSQTYSQPKTLDNPRYMAPSATIPVVHADAPTRNNTQQDVGWFNKWAEVKPLIIGTGVFLLLFLIFSFLIIQSQRIQGINSAKVALKHDITQASLTVQSNLEYQLLKMDDALSTRRTAADIINSISNNQGVAAAALLNSNNEIISGSPLAASMASVDISAIPQSGVLVTSFQNSETQTISPVIVRRAGQAYLLVAYNPGTFIGAGLNNATLLETNGKVIDGNYEVGRVGSADYYGLAADRLSSLLKSTGSNIRNHNRQWLTTTAIPNSSLAVALKSPVVVPGDWKKTALFLTLLFLCSSLVIYSLLKTVFQKLNHVTESSIEKEISQQRYRAAVDSSRGGIWEVDLGANQAYLSRSLSELLGLQSQQQYIPVEHFLNLFRHSDREKLLYTIKRAHMAGAFDLHLAVARLPLMLSVTGRPSTRGVDNSRVIIGMALDVTEQQGAQARLQAAEARLFDALRAMNDSFVIWDQRDQLVLWNNRFEDFFGFAQGVLHNGLDHARIEYNAGMAIEKRTPAEDGQGYEILLKDGRWIRYLETSTADGGRVSIGTDITAIRTREHQLQENEKALQKTVSVLKKSQGRIVELAESYEQEKIRAEEANQSKSEFLANMSHELRTPLNAINGFSDIMKREMFGPLGDSRYKEYVNDILFSGQHLLSLINDILDMSKIEAGKMKLLTEALQMPEMITQVIRIVRGRADDKRLKLIYDPIPVQEVEADPRAVKQVLLNLITNAIKFTPESGSVTIFVEPKSSGLIITVKDTGIGISQEDLERLAQPFEQVENKDTRQKEGTGLGLALSKSLVELHGGNFRMESEIGEGTSVIFTLPNRPVQKSEDQHDTEVADEITKLAQDIADVLSEGQIGAAEPVANLEVPTGNLQPAPPMPSVPTPGQIQSHSEATAPPPMPNPYAA